MARGVRALFAWPDITVFLAIAFLLTWDIWLG